MKQQQFQSILSNYFDKVKKHLPRQYVTFKDFVNKMQDLLKTENQMKLGKYASVLRLTINMKNSKLKELAINTLLVLVSNGYIDGQQLDTTSEYFIDEFSELFDTDKKKGPLIETLIYSASQCLVEKDEFVMQTLKLLVAFVTIPSCQVQGPQLVRILRSIIYVYTQSKSQQLDRMAKSSLIQIVNLTFQGVEQNLLNTRQRKKSQIKVDSVQKLVNMILTNAVDDVVLQGRTIPEGVSMDNTLIKRDIQYTNEKEVINGTFGWCILCRESAEFYCKENRVPICSFICKRKYVEFLEQTERKYDGAKTQYEQSLQSALQLFDSLCKLLIQKSNLGSKNQMILLELILYILENPDLTLTDNPQFLRIIKDTLCGQLLKFCLETDKSQVNLSFRIFQQLVLTMRKNLKHEIAIFINQIFLNILQSTNSQYYYRQIALESLVRIFQERDLGLEFYINYDCNMQQECVVEKLIHILYQIVVDQQYQKQEYQAVIGQQNDHNLRILAGQMLANFLNGLVDTYDYYEQLHQQEIDNSLKRIDDDEDLLANLEQQRQLKQEVQKGALLFNKKPMKGIQYLINHNVLQDNEKDIAKFLRENNQLSKDAVGEYMGGHEPLQVKVLGEHLRYYLDQFTLPKESQQVDRVVQKFADKFYRDNSTQNVIFKTSDAVYTFTYLMVMLQTDLHNPKVVDKMKLTDFSKLAKSINDGDDLPMEYLQQTYSSIQKTPLAVHEQEKSKKTQESNTQSMRKRQDQFQKETEVLIKKSKEMIKNQQDQLFIQVDSSGFIRPILETMGNKIFSVFTSLFSLDVPDSQIVQLCCKGQLGYLKLCYNFQINIETYIQQLIKCASFNQIAYILKRHMTLIQQFLATVPNIGNGIKEQGWKNILDVISRLDDIRSSITVKDLKPDSEYYGFTYVLELHQAFEQIDKLFVLTKNLEDTTIQEFIVALCQVSKSEIYQQNPRLFSLQKLVEVSDYNMDRVRLIWTKMWGHVRDHINEVAVKEKRVAMFAVDSLKQLSIKFLQKDELYNFQFQREVLKPFETIYISSDQEIKEFILSCINSIVLNHKSNIKSGWRVIFDLINLGLKEDNEKNSRIAFQILERIMNHNLDMIQDVFVDLIQSLSNLGRKDVEQMSLASVEFANQCLHYLSSQAQVQPKNNWEDAEVEDLDESIRNTFTVQQLETYWVPLLGMLSGLAGDKRAKVQESSMDSLFKLLHSYGYAFSIEFWKIVFQVVLRPLFDEIQFTFQQQTNLKTPDLSPVPDKENKWFKVSCKKGFSHITNLMNRYFHKLSDLLPDLLKLFENCVQNQNEKLAKFSLTAVKNMIFKIGKKFQKTDWDEITLFMSKMFKQTTPSKLFNKINDQPVQANQKLQRQASLKNTQIRTMTEESYTQCVSQMQLIQITKEIVEGFNQNLQTEQLTQLEDACYNSFMFAKTFNSQIEQRYLMWSNGFMSDLKHLPGLLKQEREAYACMLTIKYYILQKLKGSDQYEVIIQQYHNNLLDAIKQFVQKHQQFDGQGSLKILDDNYENKIKRLKQLECERETLNSRTLLDLYILPKILQLDAFELANSNQQYFDALLQASQYSQENSIIQQSCLDCRQCQRCKEVGKLFKEII
ncbi:hypothetical protein pb186bvf_000220 [Paramecium bursaria]